MNEEWKDIEGYDGRYQVSNLGNVRRIEYSLITVKGYIFKYPTKNLKLQRQSEGYLQVGLTKDGIKKKKYVHNLVAEAFIPNPHNLPEINHKDYDKTNNNVNNLEWCTHQYNIQDMLKHYDVNLHEKKYCIDCGKEISFYAIRCLSCENKQRIRNNKHIPTRDILKELIRNNTFTKIGEMFNVSDNAVKKWCDRYHLPRLKKVINNYSDEEWLLI